MTDKEQIKELAEELIAELGRETVDKFIEDDQGNLKKIVTYSLAAIAESLYKAGYRNVSNGAVVLTAEENSEYLKLKADIENAKEIIDFLQKDNKRLFNSIATYKDLVRKETAKEIYREIYLQSYVDDKRLCPSVEVWRNVLKKYGVEVEK